MVPSCLRVSTSEQVVVELVVNPGQWCASLYYYRLTCCSVHRQRPNGSSHGPRGAWQAHGGSVQAIKKHRAKLERQSNALTAQRQTVKRKAASMLRNLEDRCALHRCLGGLAFIPNSIACKVRSQPGGRLSATQRKQLCAVDHHSVLQLAAAQLASASHRALKITISQGGSHNQVAAGGVQGTGDSTGSAPISQSSTARACGPCPCHSCGRSAGRLASAAWPQGLPGSLTTSPP